MWRERLIIAVGPIKKIDFEIAHIHQFGYNPDELVGVMTGEMEVYSEREKLRSWDVRNSEGKKVGVLTATVTDQFHMDNKNSSVIIQEVAQVHKTTPVAAAVKSTKIKELKSYEPVERQRPEVKGSRHFITIFSIIGTD